MGYAQRIQQKKFRNGSLVACEFSAGGSVSISGSVPLVRKPKEDELADVHAQMLLEGTNTYSKRQLQEKLDAMGASLSFSPADDRLAFAARVLNNHFDELLELVAHILLEPRFPQEELAVLKKREEANLAMNAQDTRLQAGAAIARLLYRAEHPNYEESTNDHLKQLAGITQDMLRSFHARLSARGMVCVAVGDIRPAKAFEAMRARFDTLPNAASKSAAFTVAKAPRAAATVATIPHKASIDYMAAIATRITNVHKDYPALLLGLQILGNNRGFSGRLMSIVREQEGLTYGVYAYLAGFNARLDGYLIAWGTFAPELFDRGRGAVLREIRRIVQDGATEDEVKVQRRMYEARTRTALSNSAALARTIHEIIADGRKLSEIDTFPKRVAKLTRREVNTALKKYLIPTKLAEAAAGPIEKL